MGAEDPRLNAAHKTDFCIAQTLVAWKKEDPSPNRVKSIPILVIRRIAFIMWHLPDGPDGDNLCAAADMITIAFF